MKIVHIIPSLNSGGAETMLYKLLKFRQSEMDIEIITFISDGFYANEIREMNISVHEINIKKLRIKSVFKIINILKGADIVQSWMYHSDLIALIFGKLLLKKRLFGEFEEVI